MNTDNTTSMSRPAPRELTLSGSDDYSKSLLPRRGDSATTVQQKLTKLADAISLGQSIAVVTQYAACVGPERDPVKLAVAGMTPQEHELWSFYDKGDYPLPDIDWDDNRLTPPTSAASLRIASRRAEALNRLYKTDRAEPGHVVWLTQNEAFHLPLVKAMARVIGAEMNLRGGQGALSAVQMADLQTVNDVLSVSSETLRGLKANGTTSRAISAAQRTLGSHRDMLRGLLAGEGMKRKRESEETVGLTAYGGERKSRVTNARREKLELCTSEKDP